VQKIREAILTILNDSTFSAVLFMIVCQQCCSQLSTCSPGYFLPSLGTCGRSPSA